jgi:hypothetical protein
MAPALRHAPCISVQATTLPRGGASPSNEDAAMANEHLNKTGASLAESTGAVGSPADIREHMEVYASCGTMVGKVDHVEGDSIKLTKNDSPDGQHHRIPLAWVAKVHDHIHLSKDHKEVQGQW